MKLTKFQKEALDAINTNVTIQASAGAGKTGVLIEILYRMIVKEKCSIENVLAMTFTDLAAQEMKKRLHHRLVEGLKDSDDKEYIKRQIALLPSSDVSTIHAFCHKICKNYSYLLGGNVDKFNHVLDESLTKEYKHYAIKNVINNALNNSSEEFEELVNIFSKNGNDTSGLERVIIEISNKLKDYKDPNSWYEIVYAYYDSNGDFDKMPDVFKEEYINKINKLCNNFVLLVNNYINAAKITDNKPALEKINELKVFIDMFDKEYKNYDFNKIEKVLDIMPSSLPGGKKILGKDIDEKEAKSFDNLKKAFSNEKNELLDELKGNQLLKQRSKYIKPRIKLLLEMVNEYQSEYQRLKDYYDGIDFDDMEKYAIKILELNDGLISNKLKEQYKYILVDEYQDSNDVQEKIVSLICRNNPGNVYRIGDVKQSIYRFRGAKPKLLRDFISKEKEDDYQTIRFMHNFRSTENIINFNNELYNKLMNIKGYQDKYEKDNDFVGYGVSDQSKDKSKIELEFIDYDDFEDDKEFKLALAKETVNKIIWMKENTEFKKWSDYVVLVRTHDDKAILEPLFKRSNIPYFFLTKSGYFTDEAISSIISWLRFVDDKTDMISLLGILVSAFYKVSDDTLAKYRKKLDALNKDSEKHYNYFDLLKEIKHPFINDYDEVLKGYKDKGIVGLLEKIYAINDFYHLETTINQRDNLDQFFEFGVNAENDYKSLKEFLTWIELSEKNDQGSATSISNSANVVKVMTIHASKGLQFPVVLYMADYLNVRSDTTPFKMDESLGLSFKDMDLPYRNVYNPSLNNIINYKNKRELVEESIRLMYVATTRPQNRLIIITGTSNSLVSRPSFTNGYLENNCRRYYVIGNLIKLALEDMSPSIYEVKKIKYDDIKDPKILKVENKVFIDQDLKYQRKLKKLNHLSPSKLDNNQDDEHGYKIVFKEDDPFKRGLRLHKALELIDFNNPSKENFKLLKLDLTDDEINKLLKFFESKEYQLIKDMNLYKEYPFIYQKGDDVMAGTMDLVAISDDVAIVIDYKSNQRVNEKQLIDKYYEQISSYKEVLKKLNLKVKGYLYSIELDKFIEI